MTFCKTQLALAAGVATIAVGVTWYLNPAVRRWRRLRKHARRALPPPRCAVVAAVVDAASPSVESAVSVENMAGPEQRQQQRETRREAAEKRRDAYELDLCRKPSSWCTHLLELPDDLLVLILASLPPAQWYAIRISTPSGRCCCCTCRALAGWGANIPCCTARQGTVGKALASAGACCKTFANGVTEAATVVAGHHGWRLPLAGCTPVRHLSKLEQDTMRVRFCLGAISWRSMPYYYIEYVQNFWTAELSLALSAPSLYIDAQVRQQHTLELGALLFRVAMDAWRRNGKTSRCCTQLLTMMAHPGTPLDSLWLAARVTPYMEKYILDIVICDRLKNSRRIGMVELLSHLEPHVLRDYPVILEWLHMSSVAL